MTNRRLRSRRTQINYRYVIFLFLVVFIVLFFWEIVALLDFLLSLLALLLGINRPVSMEALRSLNILCYTCGFGFVAIFLLWLFIAGPVVLPVRGFHEVRRAPMYLFLYIMGWHGPRLYVENGKIISNQENMSPKWPGVIVLDANSAIALEAGVRKPDLIAPFRKWLARFLRLTRLIDRNEKVRVRGPGVVFIWPEEETHAVMDLRRQFRISIGNVGYTRDGIEVHSPVWVIFTIGQKPDILDVVYAGEIVADKLRMATIQMQPNGRILVKDIAKDDWDLDAADRTEFHEYARRPILQRSMTPFFIKEETTLNCSPSFDPDRVFKAAFGQALYRGEMLPWHDLPNRVAVDFYREHLSKMNYMDMFNSDPSTPPYNDLKRRVRLASRNNGILACRLVRHRDNKPLEVGKEYDAGEILVSNPLNLTNSKVLRDRGVKVIAAGFPELKLPEVMYVKRLYFWKSNIDSEAQIIEAQAEFNAMKEKNRARAAAQREMVRNLHLLLNEGGVSKEALALRVLQALEQAAVDPQTRQLLPEHTLSTLRMLHDWLLPGDTPTLNR